MRQLQRSQGPAGAEAFHRRQQLEEGSLVGGGEADEPLNVAGPLGLAFQEMQRVELDAVADEARESGLVRSGDKQLVSQRPASQLASAACLATRAA